MNDKDTIKLLTRIAGKSLNALQKIYNVSGNDVKNTVNIGEVIEEVTKDAEVVEWLSTYIEIDESANDIY